MRTRKPDEQTEIAEDTIAFNTTSVSNTNLLRATSSNAGLGGDTVEDRADPITKAIREEILKKQMKCLQDFLFKEHKNDSELSKYFSDERKFREFLSTLNDHADRKKLIDDAFKNKALKEQLEKIELDGYKHVHETFKDRFTNMHWSDKKVEGETRSQIVKNDNGEEICTLTETTSRDSFTITKQDGTAVSVSSYRKIDFPTRFDKNSGAMHLSIVALKSDGTRPTKDKAVYFTAHYEEGPDGKPLLKEVSSPQPLKFAGDGDDAIAYIEHGGEIYTLAVTRGKYREMLREVSKNRGQTIDLSPVELGQDSIEGRNKPATQKFEGSNVADNQKSGVSNRTDDQKSEEMMKSLSQPTKKAKPLDNERKDERIEEIANKYVELITKKNKKDKTDDAATYLKEKLVSLVRKVDRLAVLHLINDKLDEKRNESVEKQVGEGYVIQKATLINEKEEINKQIKQENGKSVITQNHSTIPGKKKGGSISR